MVGCRRLLGDHVRAIPEVAGATLGRASRPRKHKTMLYFIHLEPACYVQYTVRKISTSDSK